VRKIICDRCGADISKDPEYGLIWMGTRDYNEEVSLEAFYTDDWSERDFCDKCMGEIRDFILGKPATPTEAEAEPEDKPETVEPVETEPEAEAEPAKAKTVKPKELDTGKVTALYKAGWSYKAIADELRSNVSAIGRVIRLAKEEGTI
jgi:ribosome-binding protein aMBF1 (putative translation factor)